MTHRNNRFGTLILSLAAFYISISSYDALAQDSTNVYIHGDIGMSFDIYKSSGIESLVPEELNIHSLGFPFQYGFRCGFRDIIQIEYCKYSTSSHNIGTGGFVNGQIVTTSIPMKLKSSDILFKLNPAFWKWSRMEQQRSMSCLFLILGNGDVSYRDNVGDGFDGAGIIYGLELAGMSRYVSFSAGMTYQDIKYDTITLFSINAPYDVKAKRYVLYARIGVGYGR